MIQTISKRQQLREAIERANEVMGGRQSFKQSKHDSPFAVINCD